MFFLRTSRLRRSLKDTFTIFFDDTGTGTASKMVEGLRKEV